MIYDIRYMYVILKCLTLFGIVVDLGQSINMLIVHTNTEHISLAMQNNPNVKCFAAFK